MLNTQINNTITTNVDTQVVVAGQIVAGMRGERRDLRPYCATGKRPEGALSHSARCSDSCSFEHSDHLKAAGRAKRSAIAARHLPAPAWGSLVVLRALSS